MRFVLKAVMAVVLVVAGFTMGWVAGQSGFGQEVDRASIRRRRVGLHRLDVGAIHLEDPLDVIDGGTRR